MKKIIILLVLFSTSLAFSQEKLISKNGKITFEASVPAFEEVKAKSESASCVVKTKTGEIAALVLLKSFKFKIALMEEHFNENYVESDKYPKATFKGKIVNFEFDKISKTSKDFIVNGTLELHGKSKEISITAKIKKSEKGIELVSNFSVNADDFDIEIPSVVSKKVSKKVNVKLDFILN